MLEPRSPADGLDFGLIILKWFQDQHDLKFLSRCCSSTNAVMFIKTGDENARHIAAVIASGKFLIKLNHADDGWDRGVDLNMADPKFFEKLHEHLSNLRKYEPQG